MATIRRVRSLCVFLIGTCVASATGGGGVGGGSLPLEFFVDVSIKGVKLSMHDPVVIPLQTSQSAPVMLAVKFDIDNDRVKHLPDDKKTALKAMKSFISVDSAAGQLAASPQQAYPKQSHPPIDGRKWCSSDRIAIGMPESTVIGASDDDDEWPSVKHSVDLTAPSSLENSNFYPLCVESRFISVFVFVTSLIPSLDGFSGETIVMPFRSWYLGAPEVTPKLTLPSATYIPYRWPSMAFWADASKPRACEAFSWDSDVYAEYMSYLDEQYDEGTETPAALASMNNWQTENGGPLELHVLVNPSHLLGLKLVEKAGSMVLCLGWSRVAKVEIKLLRDLRVDSRVKLITPYATATAGAGAVANYSAVAGSSVSFRISVSTTAPAASASVEDIVAMRPCVDVRKSLGTDGISATWDKTSGKTTVVLSAAPPPEVRLCVKTTGFPVEFVLPLEIFPFVFGGGGLNGDSTEAPVVGTPDATVPPADAQLTVGFTFIAGTPVVSALTNPPGIMALGGRPMKVRAQGRRLTSVAGWVLRLFNSVVASDAECTSLTPSASATSVVLSSTTAEVTLPAVSLSQPFLGICLGLLTSRGDEVRIATTLTLRAAPVSGFAVAGSSLVQKTSILAVKGVPLTYAVKVNQSTSRTDLISPSNTAFVMAPSCLKSVIRRSGTLLQWNGFNQSTGEYSFKTPAVDAGVDEDGSPTGAVSGAEYELCVLRSQDDGLSVDETHARVAATDANPAQRAFDAAGVTFGGTSLSVFSTGVTVTYANFAINGRSAGVVENIGHFAHEPLSLVFSGSGYESLLMWAFVDEETCSNGPRGGNTTNGLPRTETPVLSCGESVARVTLPAPNATSPDPLKICLAVAPMTSVSSRVYTDSLLTLTVSGADRLAIKRENSDAALATGDIEVQPIVALRDGPSGPLLSAAPRDFKLVAEWWATKPEEFPTGERYIIDVRKGDGPVDLGKVPLRFLKSLYGISYQLRFTAEGFGSAVAGVNSTVAVQRARCESRAVYASLFTADCIECPIGAQCEGTTVLRTKGQYWRASNQTAIFHSCSNPFSGDTCLEGSETGACRKGHRGPRCSECVEGYGKSIDQCYKCRAERWVDYVIIGVAVFLVAAFFGWIVYLTKDCRRSDQLPVFLKVFISHVTVASTIGQISFKVPQFVSQSFSFLRQSSRPTIEYSAFDCVFGFSWHQKFVVINSLPILAVVMVLPYVIFRFIRRRMAATEAETAARRRSRVRRATSTVQIAFGVVPPGAGPLAKAPSNVTGSAAFDPAAASENQLLARIEQEEREDDEKAGGKRDGDTEEGDLGAIDVALAEEEMLKKAIDRRRNSIHFLCIFTTAVLFYAYPSLVSWCSKAVLCEDIDMSYPLPNGESVTSSISVFFYDRMVKCSENRGYRVAAFILAIFWGVGVPVGWVVLFLFFHVRLGRALASRLFAFAVAGYRRPAWWWESLMMLRKASMILIVTFISSPRLQTLLCFWTLAVHLVAHMLVAPYEYQQVDIMEQVSLFALCGTLNMSLLFEFANIDSDDLWQRVLGFGLALIILLMNAAVILWMLKVIVVEGLASTRRWVRVKARWIDRNFPTCIVNRLFVWGFSDLAQVTGAVGEDEEAAAQAVQRADDFAVQQAREALLGEAGVIIVDDDEDNSDWSDDDSNFRRPNDAADDDAEFTLSPDPRPKQTLFQVAVGGGLRRIAAARRQSAGELQSAGRRLSQAGLVVESIANMSPQDSSDDDDSGIFSTDSDAPPETHGANAKIEAILRHISARGQQGKTTGPGPVRALRRAIHDSSDVCHLTEALAIREAEAAARVNAAVAAEGGGAKEQAASAAAEIRAIAEAREALQVAAVASEARASAAELMAEGLQKQLEVANDFSRRTEQQMREQITALCDVQQAMAALRLERDELKQQLAVDTDSKAEDGASKRLAGGRADDGRALGQPEMGVTQLQVVLGDWRHWVDDTSNERKQKMDIIMLEQQVENSRHEQATRRAKEDQEVAHERRLAERRARRAARSERLRSRGSLRQMHSHHTASAGTFRAAGSGVPAVLVTHAEGKAVSRAGLHMRDLTATAGAVARWRMRNTRGCSPSPLPSEDGGHPLQVQRSSKMYSPTDASHAPQFPGETLSPNPTVLFANHTAQEAGVNGNGSRVLVVRRNKPEKMLK